MSFSGGEIYRNFEKGSPPLSSGGPGGKAPGKFFKITDARRRVLAHFGYKIMHFNAPGLMSAASSFQTNFNTFDLKSCQ
jgi:hypothetical protein